MTVLPFFEEMRWANADWYTASPLEQMSEEKLAELAGEADMTVEKSRQHLATPHVEAACPLCGQPQTHLIGCKGCGSGAWGWEFEEVYGKDARPQLRERLQVVLNGAEKLAEKLPPGEQLPAFSGEAFSSEQIQYAARHAYSFGSCMVCAECWRHTLPGEAYQTCPLKLLSEPVLEPSRPPHSLLMAIMFSRPEEDRRQVVAEWIDATWTRWTETWNTVAEPEARKTIANWRAVILYAALLPVDH